MQTKDRHYNRLILLCIKAICAGNRVIETGPYRVAAAPQPRTTICVVSDGPSYGGASDIASGLSIGGGVLCVNGAALAVMSPWLKFAASL